MDKEQRAYLKERLGDLRQYQRSRYNDRDKERPHEIRVAQALIAKWETARAREVERVNKAVRTAYHRVTETLHGNDYAAALKAVREFEKTHNAEE